MPVAKVRRKRAAVKNGAHHRGGRVKDALDWGRKEQRAKDRKQIAGDAARTCRCGHTVADHLGGDICIAEECDCQGFLERARRDLNPVRSDALTTHRPRSLDAPLTDDGAGTLHDILAVAEVEKDDDEWLRFATVMGSVRERFAPLSPGTYATNPGSKATVVAEREAKIEECLLSGLNQTQIANALGISRPYVSIIAANIAWKQRRCASCKKPNADKGPAGLCMDCYNGLLRSAAVRAREREERLAKQRAAEIEARRLRVAPCLCGHRPTAHFKGGWCEHKTNSRYDCTCRRFVREAA